ncbi:MAG: DUF805 domain-containing protein [Caulobacteraceae bacterium]|nr:DUF805 domain-containing protein [Caulobacteraceae bacterium]
MNIDWQDLFLKPSGRIGQKEFWIGILILFVAGLINNYVLAGMSQAVSGIVGLVLIYPGYCVLSSRFADFGKSPKLALLPYAVMAVGFLVMLIGGVTMGGSAIAGSDAGAAGGLGLMALGGLASGVGAVIWFVFVIWAGVAKGDPAPNAYGPPPADPTAKA